ncbi:hypothetical protein CTI12_AA507840 [Artemisia annua]|uniref:Uncharacterized protein n=1 Tax=Artemisia annua TaxID=35608 RepID=A0A2U1LC29_ARTAN|nr:hypothetical protein CTI12_AA507840 [Artemisia annua]
MEDNGQQSFRVQLIAIFITFGFISAAFGFAVEAMKPQLDEVKGIIGDGCYYPSKTIPMSLGAAAIVALLVIRAYCPGIRSSSSVVQLSRYLSWVAWFGAMTFYIIGLMLENQKEEIYYRPLDVPYQGEETHDYSGMHSYYVCNVVKPGIFGAGASFALTSITLEIIYLVVTLHGDKTTSIDPSAKLSAVA